MPRLSVIRGVIESGASGWRWTDTGIPRSTCLHLDETPSVALVPSRKVDAEMHQSVEMRSIIEPSRVELDQILEPLMMLMELINMTNRVAAATANPVRLQLGIYVLG